MTPLVASPPAEQLLRVALEHLPQARSPELAALHLVLPVDVVVPTDLQRSGGGWLFRGVLLPSGDLQRLVEAVTRTTRPGDRYLDLAAPRWTWVKPRRSGMYVQLHGPGVLWGGPAFAAEPQVPVESVTEVMRAWRLGQLARLPGVCHTQFGTVAVTGDGERRQLWFLGG